MTTIGRSTAFTVSLRLVDMELHPIELLQEVVGEFDVGLVDLVDQQHRQLGRGERLPQLAALDVVADVVDALVAELAVAQAGDRVIFVEALTAPWWSI